MKVKMNTNVKKYVDLEEGASEKNVYIYVRDRNKFSACVNGVKFVLYLELIIAVAALGFMTMLAFYREPYSYKLTEADLSNSTKAFESTDSVSDISLITESTSTTEAAISLTTPQSADDPGAEEKTSQLMDADVDVEISHLQEAIKAFAENIEKAFNMEEQLSKVNSEVSDVTSKSDESQSAEESEENKSNTQEDSSEQTNNDGQDAAQIPKCDPETETLLVHFENFKINYTCIKTPSIPQDSTEEKSTVSSNSDDYMFTPSGWPYSIDDDYYSEK